VGVPAQTGAGKDTLGDFLAEAGYLQISLSDILRKYAREKDLSTVKEDLQNLGDSLRLQLGADILAKWASVSDEFQNAEKIIITGIRHPDEMQFLKEEFPQTRFIGLKASQLTRFEFSRDRKRAGDPETFEEFRRLDDRETKNHNGQDHRMNIEECLNRCDIILFNEKHGNSKAESLQYFKVSVDWALRKLGINGSLVNKERG